ncbi:MAG: DMT family transporter [Acidobacteriota bacterium]
MPAFAIPTATVAAATALSPLVLLILLACPLAWAVLDVLRKMLSVRGGRPTTLALVLVSAQWPFLLIYALHQGAFALPRAYVAPLIASLVTNVVAAVAFQRALERSPMSATVPLLALTPALATLFGVPLLGEVPDGNQILGVALSVVGALLLGLSGGAPPAAAAPAAPQTAVAGLRRRLGRLGHEPGAVWMLLVATLWALTPLIDKIALRHVGPALHLLVLVSAMVLVLAVIVLRRDGVTAVRQTVAGAPLIVLAAGLVATCAIVLQLEAIQLVWVGLVETLKRGIGAVSALLVGRWMYRERIGPQRLAAVALLLIGVMLVLRP